MKRRLIFRIIIIVSLCMLCFFVGAMVYPLLATLLRKYSDVHLSRSGSTKETIGDLLYIGLFSMLPLLTIGLWKFTPVYSVKRKVLSVFILISCISLSISLRIAFVTREAQLRHNEKHEPLSLYAFPDPVVHAEQFYLWLYLTCAIVFSAAISYLLLRERRQEVIEFSFEQLK